MGETPLDALTNAVDRNLAVVLSLPSAGMLRHHKSRFLGVHDGGLLLETIGGEDSLIQQLIRTGEPVAVSFKTGNRTANFKTKILRIEREFKINAQATASTLLVQQPTDINVAQRRHNYRAPVFEMTGLAHRLWRIADEADIYREPASTMLVQAKMRDLSVGGIGVTLAAPAENQTKLVTGQRLRIELRYEQQPSLILDGKLRISPTANPDGTFFAGIQFVGLQEGLEGRRIQTELTQIVGQLQREELRRRKTG